MANVTHLPIRVYSTASCPDCLRSKRFLDQLSIEYVEIDIDKHPQGAELVRTLNGGNRIVPMILFPDGSFLAEPSNTELARKLNSLSARKNLP